MKTTMRMTLLAGLLIGANFGAAQTPTERVLIPVWLNHHVNGAYGSIWSTELVARNDGSDVVELDHVNPRCEILCAQKGVLHPQETVRVYPWGASDRSAAVIEIHDASGVVGMNLRVQDLSRQGQTWGTQIPVVRESEFFSSPVTFANLPRSDEFRLMLRIYELGTRADATFVVRAYAIEPNEITLDDPSDPDVLIGELGVTLRQPLSTEMSRSPAYAEISDFASLLGGVDAERITLAVTPTEPGTRYWAFVSVTNNATQHVTTVVRR